MRRKYVIAGIIITTIAVFMLIVGGGIAANYAKRSQQKMYDPLYWMGEDVEDKYDYSMEIGMWGLISLIGFILIFIGVPLALIGVVKKEKDADNERMDNGKKEK
jgi:uncharacterized membrane protein